MGWLVIRGQRERRRPLGPETLEVPSTWSLTAERRVRVILILQKKNFKSLL